MRPGACRQHRQAAGAARALIRLWLATSITPGSQSKLVTTVCTIAIRFISAAQRQSGSSVEPASSMRSNFDMTPRPRGKAYVLSAGRPGRLLLTCIAFAQPIRHTWYATDSNNEREQTKHSNQCKPTRDQGAHYPIHDKPPNLAAPQRTNCSIPPHLQRRNRDGNKEIHRRINDEAPAHPPPTSPSCRSCYGPSGPPHTIRSPCQRVLRSGVRDVSRHGVEPSV
jgi:hypothetical protein